MRRHASVLVFAAAALAGCRSIPPADPIESVVVRPLRCADEVTAESVRNVVVGRLVRSTSARVLRDGEAEVVVEGAVTTAFGGSRDASATVLRASDRSSVGDHVSGVSFLVLRGGEVVGSAEWGQVLDGEALLPPERVATEAAERLVDELRDHGLPR